MAEDPRVRRSRERIRASALDLLSEHGLGGFSVDEVSRRSGVAKTTIYRHWPTGEALALDAAAGSSAPLDIRDTGTLEGDIRSLAAQLGDLLQTAAWSAIVPSLVDAAERDPQFAELHSRVQRGHADALRAVIARGVDRGDLAAHTDADVIVAGVFGPLYYRRWFSREPIDETFVDAIVHAALAGQRR
jgi:AcrR family transcriptional regulator